MKDYNVRDMSDSDLKHIVGIFPDVLAKDSVMPQETREWLARQIDLATREVARREHEDKVSRRMRPGGLRARRRDRQERQEQGYCRHGVYVGGCGADYMCGICESDGPHWLTSAYSKSERAKLAQED